MPYWQLFYHLIWGTKNRLPLLTTEVEPIIYDFLRSKATGLEGQVFALGGVSDHVHMVVSIPPKIAVSTFVGQVKAVAATKYNKLPNTASPFFWQEEYGAFSFDEKRLPNYIAYVENQKQHHANGMTIPVLERMTDTIGSNMQESKGLYILEDAGWRQEMEFLDKL